MNYSTIIPVHEFIPREVRAQKWGRENHHRPPNFEIIKNHLALIEAYFNIVKSDEYYSITQATDDPVDEFIAVLIILLNKIPGIETEYSCQGCDHSPEASIYPYIAINMPYSELTSTYLGDLNNERVKGVMSGLEKVAKFIRQGPQDTYLDWRLCSTASRTSIVLRPVNFEHNVPWKAVRLAELDINCLSLGLLLLQQRHGSALTGF